MNTRLDLSQHGLQSGQRARLHHLLFEHGLKNGTALFLPYDQGFEHGPRDFFENPLSSDPRYIIKLAIEGGFNAIAIEIGLAEKFYWDYAGEVPLILKLNAKTDIPNADAPFSPVHASVEDAVRLGASAVGYTLYVGSSMQATDFEQLKRVRQDAIRFGMPLIVWSYPRGKDVKEKGGSTSFYAVDYAARIASELGADMVKVNFPDPTLVKGVKAPYELPYTSQQAIEAVVRSANRSLLLVSGGEKVSEEAMLEKARQSMDAGATGLIFGRNIWQRNHTDSLRLVNQLREVLMR
jgi:class I fructose-bisphosphate aldolase